MTRKYSILIISTPRDMRREEGVRAIILYFLVVIVGTSSETSHSAFKSTRNELAMLFRSQFDPDDE